MAPNLTQKSRIASLKTPLGADTLVLSRFEAGEGLSELFEYRIEALSLRENINFDAAIGSNCCVSIKGSDGAPRHFNGVLVETQWLGTQLSAPDIYYSYRLVLRPWFWMLSRVADSRIFAHQNIPDIIKAIFGKHGFAKFEDRLSGSYPELEYCVQYRETDLNFVCRLMEEAGIYYFFDHSESEHQLVLADAHSSHKPKPGGAKLIYKPLGESSRRNEEVLHAWFAGRRFNTGKVALNDYDYMKPSASLLSEKEGGGSYQNAKLEVYDYPGRFEDKGLGQTYAGFRLEAAQAADHRCQAAGNVVSCCPGGLIELAEHPDGGQNKEYTILRASHSFVSDAYRTASSSAQEERYSGHYEFLPSTIPYRNPQVTPKPVVHGPQTAKVAGDGEIDVDEEGRIIVFFHWDREKEKKNARRVRIAQIWSGKEWGGIVIPRVGQEVVVEFIEGDPDRPLVTGTVYNAENTVPYSLPDQKTIAGVKSNSSEGGNGYNEFIFDDKTGSELIRMHGQKDLEVKIENDERRDIGHDVSVKIGNDRTEKIGNTWTVTAQTKIEFKVGSSTIVMDPGSITLKSPRITIQADAQLDAKAPLTQVTGTAMLVLKGGLITIN
jgi:type VI secretion system secreted protein VgrG